MRSWQNTIRLMQSRQHHIYVFREKYATNDSEPYGPVIALTVANTNAIRKITRAFSKQATDEVLPTNPSPTQAPFLYQRFLRSSLRHHHFFIFRKLPGRVKSNCRSLRNLTLLLTFQNPLAAGGQAVNDLP